MRAGIRKASMPRRAVIAFTSFPSAGGATKSPHDRRSGLAHAYPSQLLSESGKFEALFD